MITAKQNDDSSILEIHISLDEISYEWKIEKQFKLSTLTAVLHFDKDSFKFIDLEYLEQGTVTIWYGLHNLLSYCFGEFNLPNFISVSLIENLLKEKAVEFISDPKNRGLISISSLNLL